MTARRLFVAIDLSRAIAEALSQIHLPFGKVDRVAPAQMHLTLAFFAEVGPGTLDVLMERLSHISFGAFFLSVAGLGTFFGRGKDAALWMGVGSAHPHLFQLHKRVNEAALTCNLPIEERAWRPHFTFARTRGVSQGALATFVKQQRDFDAGMARIDAFHLYESQLTSAGAIHHRLLTVSAR